MRAAKTAVSYTSPPIIVQRDDGLFQLGVGDNAIGPFESRAFASAVAARIQRSIEINNR